MKEGEIDRVPLEHRPLVMQISAAITSMRQSAEWGMGAVEKIFRRLLLKRPFDKTKRQLRLDNIYRLYTLRVRITGISQIRSYFMAYTDE